MPYDSNNVFAKILRKEIPCTPIWDDSWALAFPDLHPKAKIHVLLIPKGAYTDVYDFYAHASRDEQIGFSKALVGILEKLQLPSPGFKLVTRCGVNGGQEVPHYHVHILGGEQIH